MIVTAHHREDLIETFFLRLRRGSGLNGLASIRTMTGLQRRPTPARPYPAPLGLFRPLLDVPKSRLVATATAMGLTWRDDPSNRDVRFERVALRQALPGIGALGLSAPALHLSIRRLQRAQEVVELEARRQMEGWASRPRLVDRHGGLFATIDLRDVSSEAASLVTDANADVQLRLLADTIAAFGGRVAHGCELAQLETLRRHLLQCARADGRGALTDTATTARTLAGCRIDYHRGARQGLGEARVRIWRESGRRPLPELTLAPGDGGWWDDRFALSVAPDAARPVTVRALGDAGWAFLKARVPSLALWRGIPPGAPATLPAVWDGPTLLGVPFLEQLPRTVPAWLKREIDHEMDAWNGLGGSLYRARFAPVAGGGNWK
ncbi:MAG: tRNA lysidine(34) synthetase [Hyphomicrobiaceae bacterium]